MLHNSEIGWNLDHSYAGLPERLHSAVEPVPVDSPHLVILNHTLAKTLGLDFSGLEDAQLANLFSGNELPDQSQSLAQAYAGHQFGRFTYLGDGRAHLIGEQLTPDGQRFDIQFKGSGPTPYSRRGDGRAALGPMLREYIISEAMFALGIPTTRSLAVVTTGEPVYRQTVLPGAILTRIAASHLRVGTFQYIAAEQDLSAMRALADYAIRRHYPDIPGSKTPYLDLLRAVMMRQIDLMCNWMRVGFIHGVMNTDNMTISGETIDYGPCAFMDDYHPETVFSSIDHIKRYAFANQSHIAQWNLARFAEAILPLLDNDREKAVKQAEECIFGFNDLFKDKWLTMMRAKIGLSTQEDGDEALIMDLLDWMEKTGADYTNTFIDLMSPDGLQADTYDHPYFASWQSRWQARVACDPLDDGSRRLFMQRHNPFYIPRNHQVEKALRAAEVDANLEPFHALLDVLKSPYEPQEDKAEYRKPPQSHEMVRQTFCGT